MSYQGKERRMSTDNVKGYRRQDIGEQIGKGVLTGVGITVFVGAICAIAWAISNFKLPWAS